MRPNTILMNFRLPISLKDDFDQICQIKNISMSTQLNLFIREFVGEEKDIIPDTNKNKVIWPRNKENNQQETIGQVSKSTVCSSQLIPDSWRNFL